MLSATRIFIIYFLAGLVLQTHAQNFPIGHSTITYTDAARSNRAIECEVYYPGLTVGNDVAIANGTFPVVVLGHGFAMGTNVYSNWWEEFVPEGFIFVLPNTEGSLLPAPSHGDFGLDLQFLASEMQLENDNNASPFYQHITARTAIMGHSMGGGATILGSSNFNGVDCIVGLAPAETDPSAVTAASNVSAPALILSGASDGVTPPQDHHVPIYDALGSDCKYFATIADGSHCYFANYNFNCSFGEIIPGSLSREDQQNVSYALVHPWFDYFLKDDCPAWDDFETALETENNIASYASSCENDAPVIVDNAGTLESTQTSNYQWYLDGQPINGAVQQQHIYTQSGTYQVGTINLGYCEVLSNEILIQITGMAEPKIGIYYDETGIRIRPSVTLKNVTLEWFDLLGKLIQSKTVSQMDANENWNIIDLSNRNCLLRLRSDEVVKTWKLF